jgi:glycosyltransferase involved in cell wall biosynthesis
MRILIVTQAIDSQNPILGFFHRWVEEFAKKCESVVVICLFEGAHDFPKNVRVLSLGKEGGVSRFKYLKRFYSYIWHERNNYDAVFVHMNQIYVILGGLLWRMWGKRVSLWYLHKHVSVSLFIATLLCHRIYTASPESFHLHTKKTRYVGHGIDTEKFAYQEHNGGDAFRLVTVGRISPIKNLALLIDAVALMHSREAACTFMIIGDAETPLQHAYKHALVERVRGRDIESFVIWEGAQTHDRIPKLLADADVFLHASGTGSLDKSVLEALAVGTLPVTCDKTLSRDLPQPLVSICIASVNDVQSYVRALMNIRALSKDQSSHLRDLGREYVEQHHALSRLVPKILAAF